MHRSPTNPDSPDGHLPDDGRHGHDGHQEPGAPRREPGAPRLEYPCCSERQMRRRSFHRPTLRLPDDLSALPVDVLDYLARTAWAERLAALALHPVDRAITEMRMDGLTVREIADRTGLKKWRVEKALATVGRRLEALHRGLSTTAAYPFEGWQEVYLAETRRRGRH